MIIDIKQVADMEIGDINYNDAPDFSDAFIEAASYQGRDMTEEELEFLNEQHPDLAQELINGGYLV